VRRTWLIAALAMAGIVLGIAAEVVADAGLDQAAADLATGWILLACGLWGLHERPAQGRWPLVVAAGLTWYAGNFSATADLVYLHRGPLVHAVVAATRKRSPLATAAVAAGYADGLLVAHANGWLTIAVVVALVALAAHDPPDSRVVGAVAGLAVALGLAATTTLFTVTAAYTHTVLYAYEAGLAGAALLLVAAAARELRVHGSVTDLVVELGPARRSGSVRHALARALGDPSLTIGYWLPDGGRYVDLDGDPFALPRPGTGRATTAVERDGRRIAVLVHDESLLDDQQLVVAVREAAGLMLANDRLRAEGSARLAELRASRERIVAARDEQRRRVARRLQDGVERRLADVAVAVREVRADAPAEQLELLDLFDGELEQARAELRELGRGIHPRVLTDHGLAAALAALGRHAPVPVIVTAPDGRLPAGVEAAAYFVCSEALANVAKHAHATRVRCDVERNGAVLHVSVADDGVGGADVRLGSGLRGLSDRVEALGGRLRISSPPDAGTAVTVVLPLDRGVA
jgi:signal transduction histidine kinase